MPASPDPRFHSQISAVLDRVLASAIAIGQVKSPSSVRAIESLGLDTATAESVVLVAPNKSSAAVARGRMAALRAAIEAEAGVKVAVSIVVAGLPNAEPQGSSPAGSSTSSKTKPARRSFDTVNDELPPYFGFPTELVWPLRVLAQPRIPRCETKPAGLSQCLFAAGHAGPCAHDAGVPDSKHVLDSDGKPIRADLQNFWVGLNGLDVHIIEGGRDANGRPLGIPAHSLPMAIDMYALTEARRQKYKLTDLGELRVDLGSWSDSRGMWVGCYLPVLMERFGYVGNWRGMGSKPKRALERIRQFCMSRHRIISLAKREHAVALYKNLQQLGTAPGPGEIPGWMLVEGGAPAPDGRPAPLVPELDPIKIVADYNIWTPEDLGETREGFEAWLKLTPEFMARVGQKAPLLPRELVTGLVRYPHQLALGALVAKHINQMLASGESEHWLGCLSLQDQLGQNGMPEHRRPHHTYAAMDGVESAWRVAAMKLDRPHAIFTWEKGTRKGKHGFMLYCPEARLIDLTDEPK